MSDPANNLEEDTQQSMSGASSASSNSGGTSIDTSFIIGRVKSVFTDPKGVWEVVKSENLEPASLYMKYLIVIAALPAIANYIGMVVFGISVPLTNMTIRWPIFGGLIATIVTFGMSLVSVAIVAMVVEKLGPTFGAKPTFTRTLQLAAFAMTPMYVGGILSIIPALGMLSIFFSIYGLYVLYCGMGPMTEVPGEKTFMYFGASIVASFVVMLVLGLITAFLSPVSMDPSTFTTSSSNYSGDSPKIEIPGGISIDMNKFENTVKELEKMAPPENS